MYYEKSNITHPVPELDLGLKKIHMNNFCFTVFVWVLRTFFKKNEKILTTDYPLIHCLGIKGLS